MKKILIALIAVAISLAVLTGCAPDGGTNGNQNADNGGEFYTLREAYNYGYLTQNDLKGIAYYVNNGETHSELSEDYIVNSIKESAAKAMREREIQPNADAKAEGFTIVGYYGNYSSYYVVRVSNEYDLFPTDVPNEWEEIGGVDFHITTYDTIGCCKVG